MYTSMTRDGRSGQEDLPGAGEALAGLARFRQEFYGCLWRRPDALCELADAVLTAPAAGTLPFLSLEPVFRRGHGMVYQALAEGRIDEERLRDLLVRHRPRGWPLAFAVDASTYPRPAAATNPGREWHPHSCQGHHGRRRGSRGRDGDAVIAGWSFQWLAQLSFTPDSWTAPQDMTRAGVRDDATAKAAAMIIAHSARLRADGETGIPLYVHDAGYDEAPLTWDLRDHLDRVQILVRVRNDRVMYRDPAPEPPRRGRPRKHSADRFECKDPATWGTPDQELALDDRDYGHVSVMSWGGLHPGCTAAAGSPTFGPHPSSAATSSASPCRNSPAAANPPARYGYGGPAPASRTWTCAGGPISTGFDIEHAYRFAKHGLGWDNAALRYPEQVTRRTWLIIAAVTMLRLARPIAEDCRRPWERHRPPGRLTPGRVRRDSCRLAALAGTPARPPKNTTPGPGRPKGRTSTPATRYPVITKAA